MENYEVSFYLMIFFFIATAILALSALLLFFRLHIKDVMIRLSNKEEMEDDVPSLDTPVMATGNIDHIAHEQNMTTMMDNKGRTVLLDEPIQARGGQPAAKPAAAARAPQPQVPPQVSAGFKPMKNIISVETNEVI